MSVPLVLVFVVPKFQEIFWKFDMHLPAFTVIVINISRTVRHPWCLFALLLPFWFHAPVGLITWATVASSKSAIGLCRRTLAILLAVLLVLVVSLVMSLSIPLVRLIEAAGQKA